MCGNEQRETIDRRTLRYFWFCILFNYDNLWIKTVPREAFRFCCRLFLRESIICLIESLELFYILR